VQHHPGHRPATDRDRRLHGGGPLGACSFVAVAFAAAGDRDLLDLQVARNGRIPARTGQGRGDLGVRVRSFSAWM
jgi:hypothetical protein